MKSYKCIEFPDKGQCGSILKKVFDDPSAQPDFMERPAMKGGESRAPAVSAVRTAEHRGHRIEITTTYVIKIDGELFTGHVMVDDDGHLHCHSIPYASYGSAVEFVKSVIDIYPDTYGPKGSRHGSHDHE